MLGLVSVHPPSLFILRATLAFSVTGHRARADGVESQTHGLYRAELSRAGLCVLILDARKAVQDAARLQSQHSGGRGRQFDTRLVHTYSKLQATSARATQ